ncbi:hypothetical protein [Bradyrhizobium sp. 6(2017)]|uniref:hypothetical protein n=1 Tax=Bradyrhizobium sp. 6(2017) TaxID=1197460 RepID=UPI002FE5253B
MSETDAEYFEARLIALELLFRGFLSGSVENSRDPIGEIDRMEEEFRSSIAWTRFGDEDERAERIRANVVAMIQTNFDAVRARALRRIEIECAEAGGARN